MPFAAPGAAEWLADWDAGLPVTFSDPAPNLRAQTLEAVANASAEVLRALIATDPDPATWSEKTAWREMGNSVRQDLRQIFRQWSVQDIAWAVDCGSTLYMDGPARWFEDDKDHLVTVVKP